MAYLGRLRRRAEARLPPISLLLGLVLFLNFTRSSNAYVSPTSPMPQAMLWGAPSLMMTDHGFYSFATNTGGSNVPVAFSSDFEHWAVKVDSNGEWWDAMPVAPAWTHQGSPSIWGPDVVQIADGRYVLYFAALTADGQQHCIGAAFSNNITGPYGALAKPTFCPGEPDQAIDPTGFLDAATGRRYIVYKHAMNDRARHKAVYSTYKGNQLRPGQTVRPAPISNRCSNQAQPSYVPTPIMLQEVEADGVTFVGNTTILVDNDGYADLGNTESPSLMRAANGHYFLTFSTGCYQDHTYTASYAVSTSGVAGPYRRAREPLFRTGSPRRGNLIGPGTLTLLNDAGMGVMFSHSSTSSDLPRELRTVTVAVNGTTLTA